MLLTQQLANKCHIDRDFFEKYSRFFVLSAGVIFVLTGLAKLLSGLGDAKILIIPDPVLGLQIKKLMIIAGIVELVVSFFCFVTANRPLALGVIAWISTNCLIYRLGLLLVNYPAPCHCLGTITDAIHMKPQVVDHILLAILFYLLIGSYSLLIANRFKRNLERMPQC